MNDESTSERPTVSVVIPAYNAGQFIRETLESVLAQTYPAKEICVVDDGSTDNTAEVVKQFGNSVVLVQQQNAGESRARNVGKRLVTGDWIAYLDSDDVWEARMLDTCAKHAKLNSDAALIFTDYRTFGSESHVCRPTRGLSKWDSAEFLLVPYLTVLPSCAIVPARVQVEWNESVRYGEDALFFNRLSQLGRVVGVPEILVRYRRHAGSQQQQSGGMATAFETFVSAYSKNPADWTRFLNSLVRSLRIARHARDWERYDCLREQLLGIWPKERPMPGDLRVRRLPKFAYAVKDLVDGLRK